MALNVDGIKNAFQNGDFARPNLFKVEIPYLGRDFEFKCRATSLPPAILEKLEVSYQNRKYNIGGDRTFEDWTVTVYNDQTHATRTQFIDWQARGAGIGKEITGEVPSAYKQVGTISQLDRNGEVTAVVNVYGIFPTQVGEIALDWDTNNEVESFEVTLAVDYWQAV